MERSTAFERVAASDVFKLYANLAISLRSAFFSFLPWAINGSVFKPALPTAFVKDPGSAIKAMPNANIGIAQSGTFSFSSMPKISFACLLASLVVRAGELAAAASRAS